MRRCWSDLLVLVLDLGLDVINGVRFDFLHDVGASNLHGDEGPSEGSTASECTAILELLVGKDRALRCCTNAFGG